MLEGKCNLCLKERELLNKSHIIPDFMYRPIFDDKHSLLRISTEVNIPRPVFSGEYESNILCADCDNRVIGTLEDYAKKVIYGSNKHDQELSSIKWENQLHPDGKLISTLVQGVDYKKFKLFLLSLLWRASISKRDFFKFVNLGPKEENIRKMILDQDPSKPLEFPCVITALVGKPRDLASKIITSPRRLRSDFGYRYFFHIGQLTYMFFVSEKDIPDFVYEAAISDQNVMRVIHFPEDTGNDVLKALFKGTALINLLK